MNVTGIAVQTLQTSSSGPIGLRYVMLAPDNLAVDSLGTTPDVNAPLSVLGSMSGTVTITGTPGMSAGSCPSAVGYALPSVTVGSGGVHAVTTFRTGDSALWLCSDTSAPDERSDFSNSNHSTPSSKLAGHDLMMRVIGAVNNATGTLDIPQGGIINSTLWSSCAVQPTLYIAGITIPGYPFTQVIPAVLANGYENGSPIADSRQRTVGGFLTPGGSCLCIPAGTAFDVSSFYLDNCDLKKNGKPASGWGATPTASTTGGAPTNTCSVIPSTTSDFTLNGDSTAAIAFPTASWMMRIEWN
jgi:hypothetical protein